MNGLRAAWFCLAHLQEKHKIGPMFETLLSNMVQHQPQDPLQYIIDSVEFNADYAKQVGTR